MAKAIKESSLKEMSPENILKEIEKIENLAYIQGFINGDRAALGQLNWELHDRGYTYSKKVVCTLQSNLKGEDE